MKEHLDSMSQIEKNMLLYRIVWNSMSVIYHQKKASFASFAASCHFSSTRSVFRLVPKLCLYQQSEFCGVLILLNHTSCPHCKTMRFWEGFPSREHQNSLLAIATFRSYQSVFGTGHARHTTETWQNVFSTNQHGPNFLTYWLLRAG